MVNKNLPMFIIINLIPRGEIMPILPLSPEINTLIWVVIIVAGALLIFKYQKSNNLNNMDDNYETKKIMEELLDEIKTLKKEIKKLREELNE